MNLRRVGNLGASATRAAPIAALLALAACLATPSVSDLGKNPPVPDSGPAPSWLTDLQATTGAPAAYSLVDDEQGPYFAIVGIAGSKTGAATCSEKLGVASSQAPQGLWTLEIATPASAGTYAVLSAQGEPIYPNIGGGGAVVRLLLVESGGSALQVYPVSGNVTIGSGPTTVAQERGGQHLTGSYHLAFAAEPLQGNCSYGTAIYDLGDQVISTEYVCSCETLEGKPVFACDGGGGNFAGCCYQTAPAAYTLDGAFDATACLGLCVAPLGITKACHPLNPDGG